ncbi:MAG: CoA transferase [Proteobacteria bacterium]|nr:CoA transferase [Pseudomonadota bacterium]MBU4470029.1 CoA transferase [Pseudomonadota bacterium]MCG2753809.1 CoA transferase [Desulfobacteraceae bacterium]
MGPLKGIKIIEIAGIGPGPFCAMMLADMGADIIRVDRKGNPGLGKMDLLNRSRRSIAVDLKKPEAVELILKLVEKADGIMEGFRPGVMEKLGLGPEVCLKRNPKIIFGRMTGWGQDGPLALAAGHDINYISIAGVLHAIGHAGGKPVPPLNLVGDFGGGGMLLAFGMVCGILEAARSGKGQVVDAAMVDGAASLMTLMWGLKAMGMWTDERGVNLLDSGAHFYDTYETADGKYISIGSIEPQFYQLLLKLAKIDDPDFAYQQNREKWPELKEKITRIFKTKTREEWCKIMEGSDVCFAPVLSMEEALQHPHNIARSTFIEVDGVSQPAPAPRFSRTIAEISGPPPLAGEHNETALLDWGLSKDEIQSLLNKEAL